MVAAAIAVGAEERSMPTVMTKNGGGDGGGGGGGGGDGSMEWPKMRVEIGAYLVQSRAMFYSECVSGEVPMFGV
jgi:hypothetical protein